MTPAWSFCILCLAAAGLEMDDVGFRLVQSGSSSKLMVNSQETGCTISTQGGPVEKFGEYHHETCETGNPQNPLTNHDPRLYFMK